LRPVDLNVAGFDPHVKRHVLCGTHFDIGAGGGALLGHGFLKTFHREGGIASSRGNTCDDDAKNNLNLSRD
jgi:hypothetical protein